MRIGEIGALFWRQLSKYEGNEAKAVADVKKKYFDDFAMTKDLYLFLGTSQVHHYVSHNPFMIIGTFHPKIENQTKLLELKHYRQQKNPRSHHAFAHAQ